MTLKEKLEMIWNTPGVLCPNHIVQWKKNAEGCLLKFNEHNIYYKKGRAVKLNIKYKYKRSLPWLCKNYYIAWISQFSRNQ